MDDPDYDMSCQCLIICILRILLLEDNEEILCHHRAFIAEFSGEYRRFAFSMKIRIILKLKNQRLVSDFADISAS